LSFAPVRPDMPPPRDQAQELIEKIMEPRMVKVSEEQVIFPAVRESYADLLAAVAGADLLVTHPAAPAGPLVGRKTGLLWISQYLRPSRSFPPTIRQSTVLVMDERPSHFWPGVMKSFLGLMKRSYKRRRSTLFVKSWVFQTTATQFLKDSTLHSGPRLFSSVFAAPQRTARTNPHHWVCLLRRPPRGSYAARARRLSRQWFAAIVFS